MKETLGEKFIEGSEENFSNFVLTLVADELKQYETDKWKTYTTFLSVKEVEGRKKALQESSKKARYEKHNDYYYVSLGSFDNSYTDKTFKDHIKDMKDSKNLILDLRDNRGGSVNSGLSLLDLFYDKDTVILQEKYFDNKEEKVKEHKAKGEKEVSFENIVILTNGVTASCSELVITSLKDNLDNVTIIGTKTFGKGLSMNTKTFSDGAGFMYLNAYWFGPKDTPITDDGIVPDIIIEESKGNEDVVLAKAIEFLNTK